MRRVLWSLLIFWPLTAAAVTKKSRTECLGPTQPKAYAIYLHGLAALDQEKNEEGENRSVLERLAKDLSLRIALPRGSPCPNGKLCWQARDQKELLQTFQAIQESGQSCWSGKPQYSLIGFSNGGYFAFKLYKAHQDPQLVRIIAAGSAGSWDERTDKPNPYSSFVMLMGRRDLALKRASELAVILRRVLPAFQFEQFAGAHELNYQALAQVLQGSPLPSASR